MDTEKLQERLKNSYNTQLDTLDTRVEDIIHTIEDECDAAASRLTTAEIQALSSVILDIETKTLYDEVESLLTQKEQIQRQLNKKYHQLQESKYTIFDILESKLSSDDNEILAKLHQVKLQTIDLYDLLTEIVESTLITALEEETVKYGAIQEAIKEITYEAIKEGSLNILRIRKILSTILQVSIELAEADPAKAEELLTPTLKGMREGLVNAIKRFKQRIAFIPIEAKHILIEDYDTIIEDLNQTDSLFSQVVQTQAQMSTRSIKEVLIKIKKDMRYDLDELLRMSKETADVMKQRFSSLAYKTIEKTDSALQSSKAKEAKRIGKQALEIAKNAIDSALKSTKSTIEKK